MCLLLFAIYSTYAAVDIQFKAIHAYPAALKWRSFRAASTAPLTISKIAPIVPRVTLARNVQNYALESLRTAHHVNVHGALQIPVSKSDTTLLVSRHTPARLQCVDHYFFGGAHRMMTLVKFLKIVTIGTLRFLRLQQNRHV